ncbi:MAG: sigma-70 family RNA polymerase sigma factor [Oscillospiraceae bacterium]|nr:sigma-70 family RNA polymerase sigma factor [Oscillospiraceae bacterium]
MDKAEFTEIVRAYQKQLLVIAFHYCGNRDDAEDVVQEVFVRLWAQLRPPQGEHLRSWLIRVTVNRCRDHLRSAHLRRRAPIEAADRVLTEPDETARSVYDAVTALPLPYREVVILHYYAGYTTREIGQPHPISKLLIPTRSSLSIHRRGYTRWSEQSTTPQTRSPPHSASECGGLCVISPRRGNDLSR